VLAASVLANPAPPLMAMPIVNVKKSPDAVAQSVFLCKSVLMDFFTPIRIPAICSHLRDGRIGAV
jgi:hypothetical protein